MISSDRVDITNLLPSLAALFEGAGLKVDTRNDSGVPADVLSEWLNGEDVLVVSLYSCPIKSLISANTVVTMKGNAAIIYQWTRYKTQTKSLLPGKPKRATLKMGNGSATAA